MYIHHLINIYDEQILENFINILNKCSSMTKIDEIDKKILEQLIIDSRRSNRSIAKSIGMSPGTVIERIKVMEKQGTIQGYRAILNYHNLGYEYMAIVKISTDGENILEIEEKIGNFSGVAALYDITGDYDAIAICLCKSRNELSNLIKKILGVKGVRKTNTDIVLNVIRRLREFNGV